MPQFPPGRIHASSFSDQVIKTSDYESAAKASKVCSGSLSPGANKAHRVPGCFTAQGPLRFPPREGMFLTRISQL